MSKESLLAALEEASALIMIANPDKYGPLMQTVRLQIGGITYELFGAMVTRPTDQEAPDVQGIEFGEILPMQTVISWLQKAQEMHDRCKPSEMQ